MRRIAHRPRAQPVLDRDGAAQRRTAPAKPARNPSPVVLNTRPSSAAASGLDVLIRRPYVANILGREWIIAVGGTQGAGKTTLVRLLHDLTGSEWLPAREGRGERLPVLVVPVAGLSKPEGQVRRLVLTSGGREEIITVPVSSENFLKAVRGQVPRDILPELHVPGPETDDETPKLLLLPGYETMDEEDVAGADPAGAGRSRDVRGCDRREPAGGERRRRTDVGHGRRPARRDETGRGHQQDRRHDHGRARGVGRYNDRQDGQTILNFAFNCCGRLMEWSGGPEFFQQLMTDQNVQLADKVSAFCRTTKSITFHDSLVVFERGRRVRPGRRG